MRTRLLSLCVGAVVLASPAFANQIACTIDYTSGDRMTWLFEIQPGYWRELAIMQNGQFVPHPVGARPVWRTARAELQHSVVVTYAPDPRYQLVATIVGNGLYRAVIGRSDRGVVLGHGRCRYFVDPDYEFEPGAGAYE